MRTAKPSQMTRSTAYWTTHADDPPWPFTATLHGVQTHDSMAPWFAEMGTILDRNRYKPREIFNMDETDHGIGLTQSTRCLVVRDTETKGKGKKGRLQKGRRGDRSGLLQSSAYPLQAELSLRWSYSKLPVASTHGGYQSSWRYGDGGERLQIPVGRMTRSHTTGSNASLSPALPPYYNHPSYPPSSHRGRSWQSCQGEIHCFLHESLD